MVGLERVATGLLITGVLVQTLVMVAVVAVVVLPRAVCLWRASAVVDGVDVIRSVLKTRAAAMQPLGLLIPAVAVVERALLVLVVTLQSVAPLAELELFFYDGGLHEHFGYP